MIASLNELWRTGRLIAEHPVSQHEPSDMTLINWIETAEQEYRQQLPNHPPELDCVLAIWAVKQFIRASQLLVHRELGEQFIASGLESEPVDELLSSTISNASEQATVHYTVDLMFRFLPDLERLTRAASLSDPLLEQISKWANRWPLSSARMSGLQIEPNRLEPILQNRCLRIMYIERTLGSNASPDALAHWSHVHAQYEWKTLAHQS